MVPTQVDTLSTPPATPSDSARQPGHVPVNIPVQVSVHAPTASLVEVCTADRNLPLEFDGARWHGTLEAPAGTVYWLSVDGGAPLVDPSCWQVTWTAEGPRCVVAEPWPTQPRLTQLQPGRHLASPVIYEMHVKGFGGSYHGVAERMPYLAGLGVDVIELMPVAPFDDSDNYWGYMPVVWGAVHAAYAAGDDPAAALAALIAEAHRHGIAVWLDVVFNHTGESDAAKPTWTLRGLDDAGSYLFEHGQYANPTGTGNTVNPSSPEIRRLVFEALQRFADLGVDGFRFDLASVLARDGGELVRQIAQWATANEVDIVAEAWDMGAYMVGSPVWVAPWRQWNDRFRDDVRSFWAGAHGCVGGLVQRVAGSPDLFGVAAPFASVNYVSAHDGLTMYDLLILDDAHHRAHHEPEGLRPQLLKNLFTTLLLSAGPAMFVQGDEFARTQLGHPNPYDIDGPLSWVDWSRLDQFRDLHDYVVALVELRRRHPIDQVRCYGVGGDPDVSLTSQSLAWCTGPLYVAANAWDQPLRFQFQEPGPWDLALSSAPVDGEPADGATLAPRSVAVWVRRAAT